MCAASAASSSRSRQRDREAGLRLDDRVRVAVDRRAGRARARAPRPARSGGRRRRRPAQRAPSRAAGAATTRTPVDRLKRGHDGPPGRRTASASRSPRGRRSRPRRRTGRSRCQPSISARPSSGDVQLPVTLPITSPRSIDRIGEPSGGASPSIANPTQRRSSCDLRRPLERRPPDEERLLHPGRPVHAEPPRRRVELRVHPDDHVALLEPEPEQRLEPVRPDPEVATRAHQRPPELDRCGRPGGAARTPPRR